MRYPRPGDAAAPERPARSTGGRLALALYPVYPSVTPALTGGSGHPVDTIREICPPVVLINDDFPRSRRAAKIDIARCYSKSHTT